GGSGPHKPPRVSSPEHGCPAPLFRFLRNSPLPTALVSKRTISPPREFTLCASHPRSCLRSAPPPSRQTAGQREGGRWPLLHRRALHEPSSTRRNPSLSGAPLSGAPLSGAPLSGPPLSGHLCRGCVP